MLLALLFVGIFAPGSAEEVASRVEDVAYDKLPGVIRSNAVVVAYFYEKGAAEANNGFLLLDQLDVYFRRHPTINIRLCKVRCPVAGGQFCRADLVNRVMHGLKRGQPRVSLSLSSVSPLDAVIATSLHLWLADSVTVLYTAGELAELERKCLGRCNIITAYFPSLGAAEHRLLLESILDHVVSSQPGDVTPPLRFVMTSAAEAVADLPGALYQSVADEAEMTQPRLWLQLCSEAAPPAERCLPAGFHGEMAAAELAPFLAAHARPGSSMAPPHASTIEVPFDLWEVHVVLMLADADSLERVATAAPTLGQLFRGTVGFVVVNLDVLPQTSLHQYGLDRKQLYLPSLAFITKGTTTVSAILNQYDDAVGFVRSQLIKHLRAVEKQRLKEELEEESLELEAESAPEVLKQDDELELSLPEEDDFEPIKSLQADDFDSVTGALDFVVIVGYLPWDPASRSLLWELRSLPADLLRALYRLSCLDWSDLCHRLEVGGHPQVLAFVDGRRRSDSVRPTGAAVKEFLTIGTPPVPLAVDDATLDLWTAGELTGSPLDGTDRALLLPASLHLPAASLSRVRGIILAVTLDDSVLLRRFGKTGAMCMKRNDPFQTTIAVDTAELEESVSRCTPILPELTEEKFQRLKRSQWTFILFSAPAGCPGSNTMDPLTVAVGSVALLNDNFYWMNSSEPVTQLVQRQYRLSGPVSLAAVNLSAGRVTPFAGRPLPDEVLRWTQEVRAGRLPGQVLLKSDPWLPVLPPIDFAAHQAEELAQQVDDIPLADVFATPPAGQHRKRDEL